MYRSKYRQSIYRDALVYCPIPIFFCGYMLNIANQTNILLTSNILTCTWLGTHILTFLFPFFCDGLLSESI